MACGSMAAAKEKGLVRSEGKDYVPAACGAFVPFVIVHALTSGLPAVR